MPGDRVEIETSPEVWLPGEVLEVEPEHVLVRIDGEGNRADWWHADRARVVVS